MVKMIQWVTEIIFRSKKIYKKTRRFKTKSQRITFIYPGKKGNVQNKLINMVKDIYKIT